MKVSIRTLICALVLVPPLCKAATITAQYAPLENRAGTMLRTIRLSGLIVPGDAARLARYDKDFSSDLSVTLQIHSRGGDFDESMAIGRWVRKHALDVALRQPGMCHENCVLILAAGMQKFARPGDVGLLRPILTTMPAEGVDARYRQMRAATRIYLGEMNVPASLADAMFMASVDAVELLSRERLNNFRLAQTDLVLNEKRETSRAMELGLSRMALAERDHKYRMAVSEQCGASLANHDERCRRFLKEKFGLVKATPAAPSALGGAALSKGAP